MRASSRQHSETNVESQGAHNDPAGCENLEKHFSWTHQVFPGVLAIPQHTTRLVNRLFMQPWLCILLVRAKHNKEMFAPASASEINCGRQVPHRDSPACQNVLTVEKH